MSALKRVGAPHKFLLQIRMLTELGQVRAEPDFTPSAAVRREGYEEILTSLTVQYEGAVGDYSALWVPSEVGTFVITWTFLVDGDVYTDTEIVVAVDIDSVVESPSLVPDIGTQNTCELTAKFITAGGDFKEGVYVRFSPENTANLSSGFVVEEVTAESDSEGNLSMHVVKGVKGLLTITGSGIVRRVTIPQDDAKDIFELVAESEDLLEVKSVELLEFPKRS